MPVINKIISKFIGRIEAVADYTAFRGEMIVEIQKNYGYLRAENSIYIFVRYLTENNYPINTLMKEYIGQQSLFLIARGKGMEISIVLFLLECRGYSSHKFKVKRVFRHIALSNDNADITAERLFLFCLGAVFIAHGFGCSEYSLPKLVAYSALSRESL